MMKFRLPKQFFAMSEGGGGGGSEDPVTYEEGDWRHGLPEDVQQWDEVKNSKEPANFYKQMADHRTFLGQSIRIPGEDASAEDKAAFNQKLVDKVPGVILRPDKDDTENMGVLYKMMGQPESEDKYEHPKIESEVELDFSQADDFKPVAFKHGLSQAQYQGIVADITQKNLENHLQAENDIKADIADLKKEWGLSFDNKMAKVEQIATLTGAPQPMIDAIKAGYAGKEMSIWLYNLSTKFKGEGVNLADDKTTDETVMSPSEAKLKISEIRNNKDHPYWKKSDPGHKAARELMSSLYKMANPE